MEEWKQIKEFPLYQISNFGRVKSQYGRIMNPLKSKRGYMSASFYLGDGVKHRRYIHRLVLMTFKPIRNSKKFVSNHLDCNPSNNRLDNLEWTTFKKNMVYASELGRLRVITAEEGKLGPMKQAKRVIRDDGKVFRSMAEAARFIKRSKTMISWCCLGKIKKVRGHSYRLLENTI